LPKKNREVVAGGRRWSTVAEGCGGSGCRGERESARERDHVRERATERDAEWRGLARVVVALAGGGRRWPEGVVAVGATERERERAREGATERDAKWRALARMVVALARGGRR